MTYLQLVGLGILFYFGSLATMYLYMRNKTKKIELTNVNELLTEILETNFKNNSLASAAQNILLVLKRFYNVDDVTILLYNERSRTLRTIASNVVTDHLLAVEDFCNESLNGLGRRAGRVMTAKEHPLSYSTKMGREVYFSSFTPLVVMGKPVGAILLENRTPKNMQEATERMHLYEKVFHSTALVLENVLYTENLIAMTSTDQLTQVYNRRFIDMTLAEQLTIHQNLGLTFSIAIFDIDHFKKFNDTYGHPFGDIVLHDVAQFMKEQLGENEWIARYGGEEFVLFFGRTEENEAYRKVERLRQGLAQLSLTDGTTTTNVTASFGVASTKNHGRSASELIAQADQALYVSKQKGRNCVSIAGK